MQGNKYIGHHCTGLYICNTNTHNDTILYIISRVDDVYKPTIGGSIGSTVAKRFEAIHFTTPLQKAHISHHLHMACSKLYMHACQITAIYNGDTSI